MYFMLFVMLIIIIPFLIDWHFCHYAIIFLITFFSLKSIFSDFSTVIHISHFPVICFFIICTVFILGDVHFNLCVCLNLKGVFPFNKLICIFSLSFEPFKWHDLFFSSSMYVWILNMQISVVFLIHLSSLGYYFFIFFYSFLFLAPTKVSIMLISVSFMVLIYFWESLHFEENLSPSFSPRSWHQ